MKNMFEVAVKNSRNYVFLMLLFIFGVGFLSIDRVQGEILSRLELELSGDGGGAGWEKGFGTDHKQEKDEGKNVNTPEGEEGMAEESGSGGDGEAGDKQEDYAGSGAENGEAEKSWSYVKVGEEYFEDAVFIGDSRMVGLYEYGGLENTTFYASTGLTIQKLFSARIIPLPESREKQSVEEALTQRQFSKIYLMLGINEMGTGTVETFMKTYREQVAHLQELQPLAIIYLHGIMKVTAERSAKGDYIYNEGIEERNREIAKLEDGEKIFYLDVNPAFCEESGALDSDYTFDGVHLKAEYVPLWTEFLMEHGVEFQGDF